MDSESALSKIFILIIIAMAVIIAVVLVYFFVLQPGQSTVPRFNATVEASGKTVYIYHDGGDPVTKGSFIIRVNGEEVPASAISFLHAQDWPWTVGKTLKVEYPGTGTPETVQIIHTGGKSPTLVYMTRIESPIAPPPVVPVVTTPAVTVPETLVILTPTIPVPLTSAPSFTQAVTPPPTTALIRPEPPVAAFTGSPVQGEPPLQVTFTDESSGNPVSWLWTFGDGTTATQENPVHMYASSGTYTVSLTVTSQYGTQKTSRVGYIHVGSVPSAQFVAEPREGNAPLDVQFTDLSAGNPILWEWNFGDGATSTLKNPAHTYTQSGTYSVALTATNNFGANTRIQSDFIAVTTAPNVDIYLQDSRQGNLLPGGYLQFIVVSPGSWAKVGGQQYLFNPGDLVQIFPDPGSQAEITASASQFSALRFDFVRMYVNGEKVAEGGASDISVVPYEGFKSTLILDIPAGDTGGSLMIDGRPAVKGSRQFIAYNLKPDSSGTMYYYRTFQNLRYDGGAESYEFR